eukprot:71441_1
MATSGENFTRICDALTKGALKGKYEPNKYPINVAQHFKKWFTDEEFEDEGLEEEFGEDGSHDEGFFIEYLKENTNLKDKQLKAIWEDLSRAHLGTLINDNNDNENELDDSKIDPIGPGPDFSAFAISITKNEIKFIEKQMRLQCDDLRAKSDEVDKSLYSIIQIGKQNNIGPLLTYLVDSYNRFRIQKKK